jgi:hypothetical protein
MGRTVPPEARGRPSSARCATLPVAEWPRWKWCATMIFNVYRKMASGAANLCSDDGFQPSTICRRVTAICSLATIVRSAQTANPAALVDRR